MRIHCILIVFGLFLSGCDDEGSSQNLDTPFDFSSPYSANDFTLSADYSYWELRLSGPGDGYQTITQFDADAATTLSDTQLALLDNAQSDLGFNHACFPASCHYYIVALRDETLSIINTQEQLLSFFGSIDTEAELFIFLQQMDTYQSYTGNLAFITTPISYNFTVNGYFVILDWDTTCLLKGRDLISVSLDGVITPINEKSNEPYPSCA